MKRLFSMIAILALCTGCDQRGAVKHTRFFNTCNGKSHLESAARTKGLDVGGGASSYALGGPTGEKDFQISIKGNASTRDTLIRDYKDFVEKELNSSGVTINGRSITGTVSGFGFNYHGAGVTGIVRVNSTPDENGYIQVYTFIYEHQ